MGRDSWILPFTLLGSHFSVRVQVRFEVQVAGPRTQFLTVAAGLQPAISDRPQPNHAETVGYIGGITDAPAPRMGVHRFTELRAWQACDAYKKAVYRLRDSHPRWREWRRWQQFEDSVAGPPAHLAEGFGRFSPPDFARYCVMARSSLMESQNHLIDAVDSGFMTEETRSELHAMAGTSLEEVTGLMEYLQSPEALKNARKARERRIASRPARHEPRTVNPEPRTVNPNRNPEPEPRTRNPEPRTPNRT